MDGGLSLLLSNADRALGAINTIASILPRPELLVAMFIQKEALLSSQIEGTYYTTHPCTAQHNNSACNRVLAELSGYMPGYAKGREDMFTQRDFAIQNARRALQTAQANDPDNPCTRVHELVAFPQNIRD